MRNTFNTAFEITNNQVRIQDFCGGRGGGVRVRFRIGVAPARKTIWASNLGVQGEGGPPGPPAPELPLVLEEQTSKQIKD